MNDDVQYLVDREGRAWTSLDDGETWRALGHIRRTRQDLEEDGFGPLTPLVPDDGLLARWEPDDHYGDGEERHYSMHTPNGERFHMAPVQRLIAWGWCPPERDPIDAAATAAGVTREQAEQVIAAWKAVSDG